MQINANFATDSDLRIETSFGNLTGSWFLGFVLCHLGKHDAAIGNNFRSHYSI